MVVIMPSFESIANRFAFPLRNGISNRISPLPFPVKSESLAKTRVIGVPEKHRKLFVDLTELCNSKAVTTRKINHYVVNYLTTYMSFRLNYFFLIKRG